MRLIFIVLSIAFGSTVAAANETIRCNLLNNEAIALYCVNPGGGSASGRVNFNFYDEDGRAIIFNGFCVGVAVAVNRCEEICRVDAPDKAFYCDAHID